MITGYDAFKIHTSLKLHFTQDKYDYFVYGGKTRVTIDSFEKRKDKYWFYKLSRKYPSKEDYENFLVSVFLNKTNVWSGYLLNEEYEEMYANRMKVIQSLTYHFKNDLDKIFSDVENPNSLLQVVNGEHPKLLKKYFQKEINIETLVIMNGILSFFPLWKEKIHDTIFWPEFNLKATKYLPFLEYDKSKFKELMMKELEGMHV